MQTSCKQQTSSFPGHVMHVKVFFLLNKTGTLKELLCKFFHVQGLCDNDRTLCTRELVRKYPKAEVPMTLSNFSRKDDDEKLIYGLMMTKVVVMDARITYRLRMDFRGKGSKVRISPINKLIGPKIQLCCVMIRLQRT